MMDVKVKRLHKDAVLPTKAHPTDAGADLVAVSKTYAGNQVCYSFGLAIEIPKGYVGLIFPRSSIFKKDLSLTNSVGVIDSGYRGELKVYFRIDLTNPMTTDDYAVGDRVAQLVIIPYPEVEYKLSDYLSPSDRNTGGFGSSGS